MGTEESSPMGMAAKDTALPIYEEPSSPVNNSNCCFCFPRRNSSPIGPSFWERVGSDHHDERERWWFPVVSTLKKVREWSEIVAGPRWKTFIRRFNRGRGGADHRHGKFHYDPLSYSLNFDERSSADFDEEEEIRNFSARFVAAPSRTAPDAAGRAKDVELSG